MVFFLEIFPIWNLSSFKLGFKKIVKIRSTTSRHISDTTERRSVNALYFRKKISAKNQKVKVFLVQKEPKIWFFQKKFDFWPGTRMLSLLMKICVFNTFFTFYGHSYVFERVWA